MMAYPYMLLYTVVIMLIFINLCIGVILEGFSNADTESDLVGVSDADTMKIFAHWSIFDPDGDSFIPYDKVVPFLMTLDQPWGFRGRDDLTKGETIKRIGEMNLRLWSGRRVHITDVIRGVATAALQQKLRERTGEVVNLFAKFDPTDPNLSRPKAASSFSIKGETEPPADGENISQHIAANVLKKILKRRQEAKEHLAALAQNAPPPVVEDVGGSMDAAVSADAAGDDAPAGDDGAAAPAAGGSGGSDDEDPLSAVEQLHDADEATKPVADDEGAPAAAEADETEQVAEAASAAADDGAGEDDVDARAATEVAGDAGDDDAARSRDTAGGDDAAGGGAGSADDDQPAGLTQVLPIGGDSSNLDGSADADLVAEAMSPTADDAEALDGGEG